MPTDLKEVEQEMMVNTQGMINAFPLFLTFQEEDWEMIKLVEVQISPVKNVNFVEH